MQRDLTKHLETLAKPSVSVTRDNIRHALKIDLRRMYEYYRDNTRLKDCRQQRTHADGTLKAKPIPIYDSPYREVEHNSFHLPNFCTYPTTTPRFNERFLPRYPLMNTPIIPHSPRPDYHNVSCSVDAHQLSGTYKMNRMKVYTEPEQYAKLWYTQYHKDQLDYEIKVMRGDRSPKPHDWLNPTGSYTYMAFMLTRSAIFHHKATQCMRKLPRR